MLRLMLATNVPTVKEKTAHGGKMRRGKMCGGKMRRGKRKWNCVSIYGMIGIDVRCTTRSEDRLNCVWNAEHETASWHPGVTGCFRNTQ